MPVHSQNLSANQLAVLLNPEKLRGQILMLHTQRIRLRKQSQNLFVNPLRALSLLCHGIIENAKIPIIREVEEK